MGMNNMLHIVMVFIFIGVFFNIMARPDSFAKLLSGTFSSLTDVTSKLAGIGNK